MVDFNTKKNILQKLRKKRGENKLLWLPCVIAAAFVKLWYGTVCRIGMALSDRNGNFLGMKMPEKQPKVRRQDDIVYVKKPFIGRIMSAVLAAAFVLMVAPELDIDFGVRASAVDYNNAVEMDVVVGASTIRTRVILVDTKNANGESQYIVEDEYKFTQGETIEADVYHSSNEAMYISWKPYDLASRLSTSTISPALYSDVSLVGYTVNIMNRNAPLSSGFKIDVNNNVFLEISSSNFSRINRDTEYDIIVLPRFSLKKYDSVNVANPEEDPVYNLQPAMGSNNTYDTPLRDQKGVSDYVYQIQPNAALDSPILNVGYMENGEFVSYPSGSEYSFDSPVWLKWTKSIQKGGVEQDEEATGYRVHVSSDGGKSWKTTEYAKNDTRLTQNADGDYLLSTAVDSGLHYQFYVEAYKVNWPVGNTAYNTANKGMITSGGNPNGNPMTKDLYTAPVTPNITASQNVSSAGKSYYEITVSHTGGDNNYDGIYLYRTEGAEITDEYLRDKGITNPYTTFGEWLDKTATPDGNAAHFNLKKMQSAFVNSNVYRDTDIVEGKTYYYYAVAHCDIQNGSAIHILYAMRYSYTNTTFTLDSFKRIVPVITKVTSADGQVTINWDPVNGAERYELQARQTGIHDDTNKTIDYSGEWETIYEGKNTSYEHKDLYNSDRYEYRVRAIVDMKTVGENNAVEDHITTQWSKIARATVGTLLDTPMNVRAVTADGQVTVSWDAVAGATGYDLHYSSDGDSGVIGGLRRTTYTHTNIPNDKVYTYWVVAYKEISIGGDPQNPQKVTSNESNKVKIKVGLGLAIPQDLKATTVDGQITITWSGVTGAQGYILHYKNTNSTEGEKTVDLSRTSFNHIGLRNGDIYEYWVEAYKEVSGERVYSEPSVTISQMVGAVLDAPKDFTVTVNDGKADMKWTAVKGAEGYIIHASSGGRYYQFDVSKTSYTHSDLSNGDIWTYYVTAYKTVNGSRTYSNPSESKTVTIGITLNSAVDLTATAGNRQIDLTWTAVNGAEVYVVYLYNSSTMEFEPITVTSKTSYSHVGLKNGKQYTYMVAPYKTINGKRFYGDYSMSVTAIPTTGSITDMDHELIVKGTAPYGISHSEYIKAVSNHGAFDESVDIYFSTNRESTQAVRDVLKNYADGLSSFIIYPFDISIYRENTYIEVDPEDGYTVTVTMPVPDRLIAYRDYITVVHIADVTDDREQVSLAEDWFNNYDQQLEVLPCAIVDIDNVWCVQFKCSSFSPYALVIYKEHIQDVASGGGLLDDGFADTFNSGLLLFTALPDILPNNRKLKIVQSGSKRYRIKSVTKK